MISDEIVGWSLSDRIRVIELDHNKFLTQASINFLIKIVSCESLKELKLKGCLFGTKAFEQLLESMRQNCNNI
jgi:Ran GTPase-activating protein (RanGAP) involved in mRNA processing and transport